MPAGEKHLLGFVFFQFAGNYWVNDYRAFKSKPLSDHYLDGSKKYLLITNLENFSNEFRLGEPVMTELERDAFQKISKGIDYLLEIKDRTHIITHAEIIKNLDRFMKVLVKSSSKELTGRNYMMYKIIQDYCDAEIQNQGQAPV